MKKQVIGYIFGISLLALFILAGLQPKITGMVIGGLGYPLQLYTLLAFVLASSTVASGIAYHKALDITEAKRDKSLKKLDEYVMHCRHMGRNEFSIKQELLAYGWPEEYIENSFDFIQNDKDIIDFHNYSKYINRK